MLRFLGLFFYECLFIQVYSNLEGNMSHLVNTGWAMLALIDAEQMIGSASGANVDGMTSSIVMPLHPILF